MLKFYWIYIHKKAYREAQYNVTINCFPIIIRSLGVSDTLENEGDGKSKKQHVTDTRHLEEAKKGGEKS
jgi:hypothetical protein